MRCLNGLVKHDDDEGGDSMTNCLGRDSSRTSPTTSDGAGARRVISNNMARLKRGGGPFNGAPAVTTPTGLRPSNPRLRSPQATTLKFYF